MKRRHNKRHHDIKLRVVLTERMTKEQALQKVELTLKTGIVQDGIELAFINWSTGKGYNMKSHEYLDSAAEQALASLSGLFRHSYNRRFEEAR